MRFAVNKPRRPDDLNQWLLPKLQQPSNASLPPNLFSDTAGLGRSWLVSKRHRGILKSNYNSSEMTTTLMATQGSVRSWKAATQANLMGCFAAGGAVVQLHHVTLAERSQQHPMAHMPVANLLTRTWLLRFSQCAGLTKNSDRNANLIARGL